MSNINKESIEKVFDNHFNPLEDRINDISNDIDEISYRFDNIISNTNQSPKLEPMKDAIRKTFNLDIKSSFFGVPKDSSKYTELIYEYDKEATKERKYLNHLFGNDYEKILDRIVDEKHKKGESIINYNLPPKELNKEIKKVSELRKYRKYYQNTYLKKLN